LLVHGRKQHLATMRIGAFASIGLGAAQGVVSHAAARQLHLHAATRLFISAAHLPVSSIAVDVRRIFGVHTVVRDARPHVTQQAISAFAQSTIPAPYLALYRAAAATCAGLPWTVLAGIGAVETGHGANVHRSVKGAIGPMQFLPSTFAEYGVDGNRDGVADIHNPADAIYSAARYLCLWGAGRGGQSLYDAIWAYNHADWYVRLVIQYANAYA
jgi:membrane-bound lytic murein transglycosylase B